MSAADLDADTAAKVAFLSSPEAYPEERPARVEVRETHLSWVFLTERHAYKLKKPVRLPHLDLSTPKARRANAERELRLNRRLAAWVYLDVVPLFRTASGFVLAGSGGEVVDWLLRMVRLDERLMLDRALLEDRFELPAFRGALGHLCAFLAHEPPARRDAGLHLSLMAGEIALDIAALERPVDSLPQLMVERAIGALLEAFGKLRAEIAARVEGGCVIDAHGDLRPEHVWLGDPPAIIDCLEFSDELRIRDRADEIAYLALELERMGHPHLGEYAIAFYEERTGDRPGPRLLAFYRVFRAVQRARLAVWHAADPGRHPPDAWYGRARQYLELALFHAPVALEPLRGHPPPRARPAP